jgi:hypothetical protein
LRDNLGGDEHGRVAHNRYAMPCGVDADYLSICGYKRPTGVARVERRVGLNDVVDEGDWPKI